MKPILSLSKSLPSTSRYQSVLLKKIVSLVGKSFHCNSIVTFHIAVALNEMVTNTHPFFYSFMFLGFDVCLIDGGLWR